MKTDIEDGFSSVLVNIGLNYHYLFKIYHNSKWKIHSGIGTNLDYNIGYYWIWDESHLYWSNFLSLNLSQRILYKANKYNHIIMFFSVPVFLLLSRPEQERNFKIDDFSFSGIMNSFHHKPEAKFLTNSFFINLSIEYQYKRKSKFQPFLVYSFNYFILKTTYSNKVESIQNFTGVIWNL